MYLMYVDESGDVGTSTGSPTKYFVLSAIILHESVWQNILDDLIDFRRALKSRYQLKMTEEIHASVFINGSPKLKAHIPRNEKLEILKRCLQWLNSRNDLSVFSVRVDKKRGGDIFEYAWRILIQRFDNTLAYNNFPKGAASDKGIILADNTNGGKLTSLLRQMRRFNQVPNTANYGGGSRGMTLRAVVEDPIFRNSDSSYFHQMVDVVAYFARQYYEPNKFIRTKGAKTFYPYFLAGVVNRYVTKYNTPGRIVEV